MLTFCFCFLCRKHNHAIADIRNDALDDRQYKDMTGHLLHHRSIVAGGITTGQYQLGTTKVFLRAGVLHSLNSIQEKMQDRSCVKIQRHVRTYQAWKLHRRRKAAVSGIQRLWRGCLGEACIFTVSSSVSVSSPCHPYCFFIFTVSHLVTQYCCRVHGTNKN